ncbi:DUF3231 family protein [Paenibacillus haidiansis]|uniref:DUF3231 family protein n=1 Tax=Paenibacillus haidiansis TaxID=1574488 RepID=UPI0039E09B26
MLQKDLTKNGGTMETVRNIRLTSAELASLWTTYMNDTMAVCILRYFLKYSGG